jgi:hypothetical protein
VLRLLFLLSLVLVGFCSYLQNAKAQLNSDSDKTTVSIRTIPGHIILGSLPYGSDQDRLITRELTVLGLSKTIFLTNIDLSHAEGVHVLSQHDIPNGVALNFSIDVKRFSKDQPYGKYVKKIIRLETNSQEVPQLVISVSGWLAINETPRDFNRFVFNGNERWQGIWATPNIAGSVLAPFILLILGGAVRVSETGCVRWLRIIAIGILFLSLVSLLIPFAFTYSRGAWAAFITGSLIMMFNRGCLRKAAILGLLVFGGTVLLLPSGLKRVGSYTHIEEDLSVANRIKLWTGAWQIMAEHPFKGVGGDQFGTVFERDYQQFDHTAQNSTAVSDYLTFGAEHGLILLGIILGILLFIVAESFRNAIRNKNTLQMTLVAVLASILVASAFSTLWFVREYEWLLMITLVGLLVFMSMRNVRNGSWIKEITLSLTKISGFIGVILLVLGIISITSLVLLPTQIHEIKVQFTNQERISCRLVEPRWKKPKGVIVYFSDEGENVLLLCHSTLRPLAAMGWQVVWSPGTMNSPQAADFVESLHRTFPDQILFVAGEGKGGRIAWQITANEPKSIVSAGAGFGFLSMDLDPKLGGKPLHQPFLVVHSLYDDQVPANAAICAQRGTAFEGLQITTLLTHDELSRFSSGWLEWIRAISNHFSESSLTHKSR